MGLETATYINALVTSNPDGNDQASTADDHIRLIKAALKRTFPLIAGAVSASHQALSFTNDLSASVQAQFNALRDGSATARAALFARSASFAILATRAESASFATFAGLAQSASFAVRANRAESASFATLASFAQSAGFAATAGSANFAASAAIAGATNANAVTNAMLADMANSTIKGRAAGAGTGDPQDLTAAQLIDILETADGSGSGLDADTVDGQHASAFAAASHTHDASAITSGTLSDSRLSSNIPRLSSPNEFTVQQTINVLGEALKLVANGIGTFITFWNQARTVRWGYLEANSEVQNGAVTLYAENGFELRLKSDDLIRMESPNVVVNGATVWTAGNDGSGSGLDADTVDGQHASAFAAASHAHDASAITSGTFANERIAQSNVTQHQGALTIAESQITDGAILARVSANETISGAWTFQATPRRGGAGGFLYFADANLAASEIIVSSSDPGVGSPGRIWLQY